MPSKKPDAVDARLNNFAQQYSAHRNATRAAAAAGYSPASAAVQGSQLIRRPDVKALVAKFDADLTERTNISKDWVINETLRTYAHALDLDHTATARGCLHLLALLHGSITGRGISIFRSPPKTFGPIGLARRSSAPGIGNSPTARQHAVVEVPLCADGLSYGVAQRRSCDVVF
jgi:hypothetical protein